MKRTRPVGKTGQRRLFRRRIILVTCLGLIPTLLSLGTASADIVVYARKMRDFPKIGGGTTSLATWGYLDDNCVRTLRVTCMTKGDPLKLRPEASAQAIVIYALAALLNDEPLGVLRQGYTELDWEVSPTLATQDPASEPPGDEGLDPCIPPLDPTKDEDKWRADVVVQTSSILEVKNYAGRSGVENQLNCYIASAARRSVGLVKNSTLNAASFVAPFIPLNAIGNSPADAKIWCVWAPFGTVGHVYFSPLIEAPSTIQAACKPASLSDPDPVYSPVVVAAVLAALAAALAALLGRGVKGGMAPAPQPAYSRFGHLVPRVYSMAVPQLEDRPRDFRVDWGDGTTSFASIPAGAGIHTVTFSKTFQNTGSSVRRLIQQARVGTSSLSVAPGAGPIEPDPVFEFVTDVDPVEC